MIKIEREGDNAVVTGDKIAFSYRTNNPEELRESNEERRIDNLEWTNQANYIGDYIVFPHGNHNDLPTLIRDVIYQNYIAPGLLKKKTNLLWGKGPKLYEEKFEDGVLRRDWQSNTEIEDWMRSWNAEEYILKQCIDFNYIEGAYTKFIRARGYRVGNPFISKLEHQSSDEARLACTKESYINNSRKTPTHGIVSDWGFNSIDAVIRPKVYPLFDPTNPFAHPHTILYSNIPSFCVDVYSLPDIYGSLEWIRRSTVIPLIFKALSKNGINQVFHIESPSVYWTVIEKKLMDRCDLSGKAYEDSMLTEYQEELFREITNVISGTENSGKLLHTTKIFDQDGTNLIEAGWTIKAVDQKTKDFVMSQIEIKKAADYAVGTGLQLHPALGGISESGKSDSGSEQLYALKNYLLTGVDIPEMVVCRAINYAIKANWPDTKLRLGFYHMEPHREQDVTSKDRITNQA